MLIRAAVSDELKQTDTQTDRIALYILDNNDQPYGVPVI